MEIKLIRFWETKLIKIANHFYQRSTSSKNKIFFIENQRQKLYLIKDRSKAHSLHNNH
jgi:hypothetical protein